MSNWERRRLRYSQEHYAALDAYILTRIANELYHIASYKGVDKGRADAIFRQVTNSVKRNAGESEAAGAKNKKGKKEDKVQDEKQDQKKDNELSTEEIEMLIELHAKKLAHYKNLLASRQDGSDKKH